MELKSHSAANGSVSVLRLSGRFDAYEEPKVSAWLNRNTDHAPAQIVIDLSGVNFIDSSALATLVQGMKHCRERDGDLHLCTLQQPVRIIFELTRLDKAFDMFSSEAEAIAAFSN